MVLLGVVAVFVSQQFTDSRRKDAAFRETEEYAQRHARRMSARSGMLLTDKRAVEAKLEEDKREGAGMALLYAFVREESTATEIVRFTQPYERAMRLLSPATGTADRCFTIVYRAVGTPSVTADVTAHGSDVSCARIAEELNGTGR